MSEIAIIPARGGSKRLPRKNILPLNGRPIITYAIETAKMSGVCDTVIVSTDDMEIAAISESAGARVIMRPAALGTDEAHELDACMHVLSTLEAENLKPDAFCVIYPTAAFILPSDIRESYPLLDKDPVADVIMGVAEYPIHPYKTLTPSDDGGYLKMMFPVECKQRSQTYPQAVASAGTFYWLRVTSFLEQKTYYPTRLKGYVLPQERALDIDTVEDFAWATKMAAMCALSLGEKSRSVTDNTHK